MDRTTLFAVVSAIAMATALFSPVGPATLILLPLVMPDFLFVSLRVVLFVNTLVIGVAIVLISGVPAALFERIFRRPADDDVTMVVWALSAAGLAALCWSLG